MWLAEPAGTQRDYGCRVTKQPAPTVKIIAAGVVGGLLSGLFGVGGGIVMVPLFVFWLGLDQKRAITTSLVAIIPIAVFGAAGYAFGDAVAWAVGLAIGVGSIAGGQIGVRLLPRIPVPALQIAFALLLFYSAYRLVFPSGYAPRDVDSQPPWALLIVVGVVAGVVAALLGVGGGIVIVPALVLLAGVDLTSARGTSLLVVLITAITASATNIRNGRAATRTGVIAGLAGAPAALAASFLGQWLPERTAAILFAVLMVVAAAQLLRRAFQQVSADRSTDRSADTTGDSSSEAV